MGEDKHKELRDLLRETKVKELAELKSRKDTVVIDCKTSIRDTAKKLSEENITSAPVIDEENKSLLGFIDILDIIGYVIGHWRKYSQTFSFEFFPPSDFFTEPISKILNFSKVNFSFFVDENSSLEDILEIFVNSNQYGRIHRIALINSEHKLSSVISQTDFLSFVQRHFDLTGGDKSLNDLGLVKVAILAKAEDPANKVLELMYDNRINSIALVDDGYKLVGSLSATDFRGSIPSSFDYFCMTAIQMSQKEKFLAVSPHTKFRDVIKLMVKERLHRIYHTENDVLYGVTTLTDILRYVYYISRE